MTAPPKDCPQEDGLSITHSEPDHPIRGEGERDYSGEFEAWWATCRHRNREMADYSTKKQIAFDAIYFAARAHPPTTYEGAEDALKDPATVHINMLRGGIAKPTPTAIGHLYRGADAVEVVAEVKRQNPDAFATYEGEGLRERVALTTTPSGGGRPVTIFFNQVSSFNMTRCNDDERRVVMHGGETYRLRKSDADQIIQALQHGRKP